MIYSRVNSLTYRSESIFFNWLLINSLSIFHIERSNQYHCIPILQKYRTYLLNFTGKLISFDVKFFNFYRLSFLFTIMHDASIFLEFFILEFAWISSGILYSRFTCFEFTLCGFKEREISKKKEKETTITLDILPLFFCIILHPEWGAT